MIAAAAHNDEMDVKDRYRHDPAMTNLGHIRSAPNAKPPAGSMNSAQAHKNDDQRGVPRREGFDQVASTRLACFSSQC
jgi:hypothetical protein